MMWYDIGEVKKERIEKMLIPRNEFHSTEPYRKAIFRIDDGVAYGGFKTENYWNGWECPVFTKEVAEEILRNSKTEGDIYRYDEKKDVYTVLFADYPKEEMEIYEGKDIEVEGEVLHVYGIGAMSWCWDEVVEVTK